MNQMTNTRLGFTYPNPDDMPQRIAEAFWDIHKGDNLDKASRTIKNFFGTIEWVYRMAEEVHVVNGKPFDAPEKRKVRSAFTGIPIADLRKRKKK
jgi:hypothetical protein